MRVSMLTMSGALQDTVDKLAERVQPCDIAAVKLAQIYAEELDARESLAELVGWLKRAQLDALKDPEQYGSADRLGYVVDKLIRSLAEGKALVDVGPKLFTILESLGATPKSRGELASAPAPAGTPPTPSADLAPATDTAPAGSVAAKFAERRRARLHSVGGA